MSATSCLYYVWSMMHTLHMRLPYPALYLFRSNHQFVTLKVIWDSLSGRYDVDLQWQWSADAGLPSGFGTGSAGTKRHQWSSTQNTDPTGACVCVFVLLSFYLMPVWMNVVMCLIVWIEFRYLQPLELKVMRRWQWSGWQPLPVCSQQQSRRHLW